MARLGQLHLDLNLIAHLLAITALTIVGLVVLGAGNPVHAAPMPCSALASQEAPSVTSHI